jgi:hypothetical protein
MMFLKISTRKIKSTQSADRIRTTNTTKEKNNAEKRNPRYVCQSNQRNKKTDRSKPTTPLPKRTRKENRDPQRRSQGPGQRRAKKREATCQKIAGASCASSVLVHQVVWSNTLENFP